ncbi:MAG: hypothetical protein ACRCX2_14870 [Paraclostridium sp.]
MATIIQNMWTYGITGDRLLGVRNSEVYVQSAKDITNMLITDIGSLKVMNKYNKVTTSMSGRVVDIIKSNKNYYVVLTSTNIYAVDKNSNNITQTVSHSMGNNVNISILGKDKFVIFNGINKLKSYKMGDTIIDDNTFDNMELPVKKKKTVQLDLWKISKDPVDNNKLRAVQMSAFTNPLIKSSGGTIYLHNSNIVINRIYTSYNAIVDIDYFNNPKEGEIYGILRTFEEIKNNSQYIIDNTKITFGSLTNDDKFKGSYFTSITGDGDGVFTFGELVDNINIPDYVSFYQDRCFIYKNGFMYVSKISEYDNFRNGVNSDDAFFFQLDPIGGNSGDITGIVSDFGLFVLTTVGVYFIGGNNQLTPSTFGNSVIITNDTGCTNKYTVKDNTLYYIDITGTLKALILDRTSLQFIFNTITVDKYSTKKVFTNITKLSIDDRDYVVAMETGNKYVYIIDSAEVNAIFRKTKMDMSTSGYTSFNGIDDKLFLDNNIMIPTNNKYKSAKVTINPFNFYSEKQANGMYLYDDKSQIKDIVVKMLNEDRLAIEGIKITGIPINNLPNNFDDLYNIYRLRTSIPMQNGFDIEILSNENDKSIELLGLQVNVNIIEDK